ncbi:MAG: hypothetical protein KGZ40_04640 [Clostridiales bacterium]|nr:hypothetical protein [Clostridiales bacterium]
MGEGYHKGLYLAGGIALGVVAAALYGREKDRLRPAAADLISRGLDVKDRALMMAETAKEQIEDIVAEAQDIQNKRTEPGVPAATGEKA